MGLVPYALSQSLEEPSDPQGSLHMDTEEVGCLHVSIFPKEQFICPLMVPSQVTWRKVLSGRESPLLQCYKNF